MSRTRLEPPPNALAGVVRLLRLKQWSKNLLVFAAPLFVGAFLRIEVALPALVAFLAMCLASSAVYIANDLLDVARDRHHPTKKFRPIAAGVVPIPLAVALALVLGGVAIALATSLNIDSLLIILLYLSMQAAYNVRLKHVPIADVFCIASGFVLRAALGAAAIVVPISGWLLFCTGSLALMLGFAKRRHEFIAQGEQRVQSREVLAAYSRQALDVLVIMTATGAAMCYGVYSLESVTAQKHPGLFVSTLFVVYGVARYVLLVFSQDEGGEPADILLHDPHVLGSVIFFLISAALAIGGMNIPIVER